MVVRGGCDLGHHQDRHVPQYSHVRRVQEWIPVGVQVAVQGWRGRGHHQGEQRWSRSHVHRMHERSPVSLQVAVGGGCWHHQVELPLHSHVRRVQE
tara:strand:- start:826 stop:1113 length:288 start_codon:yes stop_codon:yes gene_type:complete